MRAFESTREREREKKPTINSLALVNPSPPALNIKLAL